MSSARNVLDVDELSGEAVEQILATAAKFGSRPHQPLPALLDGRDVALLFAEASTRTRLSFERAARLLGGRTFLIDPVASSMAKGETFVDTVRNLDALGFGMLIVRHHRAGAPWVAARWFGGAVINAGDGWHAHPTQALLDLFTLRAAFGGGAPSRGGEASRGGDALRGRKIVIVGDVLHSRVARSNVWTLTAAGADVWLCGPPAWLRGLDQLPVTLATDLDAALEGSHAVMGLRVQRERMGSGALSVDEYVGRYQITEARLARAAPGAHYLHPGPINEGVEVTREVARGPRSLVLEQVRNGIPVRMAALAYAAGL